MSTVDRLRRIAHRCRSIPGQLGLRPFRVYLLTAFWAGTHTGDGSEGNLPETELTESGQPPKVRFATDEQVALGGLEKGDCVIGPITPSHSGGGTNISSLDASSLSSGQTFHVRLRYSDGSDSFYSVVGVERDSALHYTLKCRPAERRAY